MWADKDDMSTSSSQFQTLWNLTEHLERDTLRSKFVLRSAAPRAAPDKLLTEADKFGTRLHIRTEIREAQSAYWRSSGDYQPLAASNSVGLGGQVTTELKHIALLGQTTRVTRRAHASLTRIGSSMRQSRVSPSCPVGLFIVVGSTFKLAAKKAKAGKQGPEATVAERLLQGGADVEWSYQPGAELKQLVATAQAHVCSWSWNRPRLCRSEGAGHVRDADFGGPHQLVIDGAALSSSPGGIVSLWGLGTQGVGDVNRLLAIAPSNTANSSSLPEHRNNNPPEFHATSSSATRCSAAVQIATLSGSRN